MLTLSSTAVPSAPASPPETIRNVNIKELKNYTALPITTRTKLVDKIEQELQTKDTEDKQQTEKEETLVTCYQWEESWTVDGYIKQHCDYIDREDLFMLLCFERFCRSHSHHLSTGSLLELSGGPSVYNLITVAPYVQGIFFSDYLPQNLQHVREFVGGRQEAFLVPYFQTVSDIRGASDAVIQKAIEGNFTLEEFKTLLAGKDQSRKRKTPSTTPGQIAPKSLLDRVDLSDNKEYEEVRSKLSQGAFFQINLLQHNSLKPYTFPASSTTPTPTPAPITTTTTPVPTTTSISSPSTISLKSSSSEESKGKLLISKEGYLEGKKISVVAMHFVCEAIVDSISKFQGVLRNALDYVPVDTYIMFTMLENASVWEMDVAGTVMECLPVNEAIVTQVLKEAGFVDIEFSHCGGIDQKFNSYDAIMFFTGRRTTSVPNPASLPLTNQTTTPTDTFEGSESRKLTHICTV